MKMSDTGNKALKHSANTAPNAFGSLRHWAGLLAQSVAGWMTRSSMACIAVLLLTVLGAQPLLAQKVHPVEVQLQLTPPYSLYLSDYATAEERLKVNLFLKDLTKTDHPVRLKLKIEGFGITIVSKNNFYTPPIYLNGGQLRVLSGPELQDYFNPQNLMFQGIDLKTFNQNGAKLPEGVYRISFEVEDYTRRQIVSNAGGTVLSAFLSYPPVINQPMAEAKVRAMFPQNMVFQWMPRHTASVNAAFNVAYRIRLVEIDPPGRNPNDAIRSMRPLFETVTNLTQYVYGPADPQLTPGHTYALQVQAIEVDGKDAFVNQGYSEVVRFTYGEKCSLPLNVIAQIEDRSSLKLSWTQLPLQQRYAVRYREANNTKAAWFEQEVFASQFSARGLRPGVTYEYQVKAACDYGFGDYTALQTFTLPNESVTSGDIVCGEPSQLQAPTNTKLLPLLQPGMLFMAASFPVRVTEVTSQGERFTGRGTVGVPYLNKLNFEVDFKDIQINTDLKLISGRVSVRRQTLEESEQALQDAIERMNKNSDKADSLLAKNDAPDSLNIADKPTLGLKDNTSDSGGIAQNQKDDNTDSSSSGDGTSGAGVANGSNPNNTNPSAGNNASSNGGASSTATASITINYQNKKYKNGDVIYVENAANQDFMVEGLGEEKSIVWGLKDVWSEQNFDDFITSKDANNVIVDLKRASGNLKLKASGENGKQVDVNLVNVRFNVTQDKKVVKHGGKERVQFQVALNLFDKENYEIFVNTTGENENHTFPATASNYEWFGKNPANEEHTFSTGKKTVTFTLKDKNGFLLATSTGQVEILVPNGLKSIVAIDEKKDTRVAKEGEKLYLIGNPGNARKVNLKVENSVPSQKFLKDEVSWIRDYDVDDASSSGMKYFSGSESMTMDFNNWTVSGKTVTNKATAKVNGATKDVFVVMVDQDIVKQQIPVFTYDRAKSHEKGTTSNPVAETVANMAKTYEKIDEVLKYIKGDKKDATPPNNEYKDKFEVKLSDEFKNVEHQKLPTYYREQKTMGTIGFSRTQYFRGPGVAWPPVIKLAYIELYASVSAGVNGTISSKFKKELSEEVFTAIPNSLEVKTALFGNLTGGVKGGVDLVAIGAEVRGEGNATVEGAYKYDSSKSEGQRNSINVGLANDLKVRALATGKINLGMYSWSGEEVLFEWIAVKKEDAYGIRENF